MFIKIILLILAIEGIIVTGIGIYILIDDIIYTKHRRELND